MTGESATPVQLAEEVMKVVGDADELTARTAIEIAMLLLRHRKEAELKFLNEESDCSGT